MVWLRFNALQIFPETKYQTDCLNIIPDISKWQITSMNTNGVVEKKSHQNALARAFRKLGDFPFFFFSSSPSQALNVDKEYTYSDTKRFI